MYRYEPSPSPYYCSAGNGPPPLQGSSGPPSQSAPPQPPPQQANSHHPQQPPPPPPPPPTSIHPVQAISYDCPNRGRLTPPHQQANQQQYVSCKMEQMHAHRDLGNGPQHHMVQASSTSPPLAVSQSANQMYPGSVESPENSASSIAPNYFPWMKSQFGKFF